MTKEEMAEFEHSINQDEIDDDDYGFVIDEGTSVEEFILATCSGTSCTINTRGLDVVDAKTGTSTLQYEHRRGAVVKITDYPQIAILSRL
jgi:hypothetical protein